MVAPIHPHGPQPDDPSGRRDDGHQPPSTSDFETHPPETGLCSEIRGLMRDFVDGDLDATDEARVERHVHECRPCALALSRAESERMEITAALSEVDLDAVGPSLDFTETVMREVREQAVTQPTVGFTARVMVRVRETALAEAVLGDADAPPERTRVPLYVLLAATVLLATWIGLRLFESPQPAVVEVVAARNAEMVRDGRASRLVVTDHWNAREHRAADAFVTGAAGELGLLWKPGGRAVSLRTGAHSELRVGDAAADVVPSVALVAGELTVQSKVAVRVALRDGSTIRVDGGDAWLHVEGVRHQDARAGLRVKLGVRDGAARILRGGLETAVAAGSQAIYTTFSPVAVTAAPGDDLFAESRRRAQDRSQAATDVAAPATRFFGQVLDPRTANPVPDVTVAISTVFGDLRVKTDEEGRFRLEREDELRGQFVILRAVLPDASPHASALAPLRFAPVFLGERHADLRRFYLERAGTLAGRVHDDTGRAPPGLWVQPCLASSLLGTVVPAGNVVRGKATGEFAVAGLSAEPDPHRMVMLVAGGAGLRPRVVWARAAVRVEDAVLDLVLPRAATRRLGGFTPGSDVQLLYAVHGIAVDHVVQPRVVRADRGGRIDVDGSAPVFVLSPNAPPRLVVPDGAEGARLVATRLPAALGRIRTGHLAANRLHWFDSDALPKIPPPHEGGGLLTVREAASGIACAHSQVFLRTPQGELQFLGIFDSRVAVRCGPRARGTFLAGTSQGWTGQLTLARELGRSQMSLAVAKPARVRFTGSPRGVVVLQRQNDELSIPVVRPADEAEWRVPAGTYRVGDQTFTVEAGGVHTLKSLNR